MYASDRKKDNCIFLKLICEPKDQMSMPGNLHFTTKAYIYWYISKIYILPFCLQWQLLMADIYLSYSDFYEETFKMKKDISFDGNLFLAT